MPFIVYRTFATKGQALDALGAAFADGLIRERDIYHTGLRELSYGWAIVLKHHV